jgi:hypothetical protein
LVILSLLELPLSVASDRLGALAVVSGSEAAGVLAAGVKPQSGFM